MIMLTPAMAEDLRIRSFVATRVAYMRFVGRYGSPAIPEMWRRFDDWCTARGLKLPGRRMFGVAQDNPNITRPDQTRYDVCIEVDMAFEPVADVGVQTIPGGRFACVPFRGRVADIGPAWVTLLGKILPDAGYEPDLAPAIELYESHAVVDRHTEVFDCTLCMPVRGEPTRDL